MSDRVVTGNMIDVVRKALVEAFSQQVPGAGLRIASIYWGEDGETLGVKFDGMLHLQPVAKVIAAAVERALDQPHPGAATSNWREEYAEIERRIAGDIAGHEDPRVARPPRSYSPFPSDHPRRPPSSRWLEWKRPEWLPTGAVRVRAGWFGRAIVEVEERFGDFGDFTHAPPRWRRASRGLIALEGGTRAAPSEKGGKR